MNRQILFIKSKKVSQEFPLVELKKMDENSSVFFAEDKNEIFSIIDQNEIDIVVCFLSFNETEELNNLKELKEKYPRIFIVAFSDEENRVTLQSGYRFAHQLVHLPFTTEKLINSFSRKEKLSKYLHDGQLMGLLNGIDDLPTLPETYLEIEKEISSSTLSFHKISSIISHDLAFTAKVLHLVNSPFFGLRNKISDVLQAINILGVNILKSLLLYDNASSKFIIGPQFVKYFEDLWLHSNKVGRFAEQIIYINANREIKMMEDAYIAGLFHDFGKLIMLAISDYPDKVFSYMEENSTRYSTAEYKLYGTSHSEVGAYFLTLWGFPDRTADAVFMHNNYNSVNFETFSVPNALFIANLLAGDENLNVEDLKKLNLGVHPKDWLQYLDDNGLLKVKKNN